MKKPITRAEALRIFKVYGLLHPILSDELHNPEYGQQLKNTIKKCNDERKES